LAERLDEAIDDLGAEAAYAQAEQDALTAARHCSPALSPAERAMLAELGTWAQSAQDRPDAKFRALRGWLDPIVPPAGESPERVIIFTEYRATQRWLYERLLAAGYPKQRLALLYGGQDEQDREHVKNAFTADPELDDVRVLIATDAASEGINLQWHCHRVLHWEIPWNPNRLEQRNGRVDRHGQCASEVQVRHFVPAGWQTATASFITGSLEDELDFLRIAVEKVDRIREDLGSAGEVISAQVERKMLGKQAEWITADTEIERRAKRATLKVERDLARDLQRLTETLAGSRAALDLTPATVEQVVRIALKLAHRRELRAAEPPESFDAPVFRLPELPGAWAAARNAGLYHPLTGEERLVTFDQDAVAGRSDIVLLHLGHRLVQMCLRLLRAELWAQARNVRGAAKLSRVTARVVPGDLLRVPAVVAHGRVVVTGAEGTRLHEEVMTAGGLIEQGRLARANTDEVASWLAAASDQPVPAEVRERLRGLWPELSDPLGRLLARRAADRTRSMQALLRNRCDEEVTAVAAVLDELERSIRGALGVTEHWQQPSLFEDERDQLRTDHESLLARLDALPDQREDETAALRRRYADPTARWFPAAVEFLVPAAIAKAAR
jgi:hypothetical protein